MSSVSIQNVRVVGLAGAIPRLEEGLPANVAHGARRAKLEQCQSDFCFESAKKLVADLGWEFNAIDTLVMATVTPDYLAPSTSIILQDRLGVPKSAVAFDLPSGGLGFLHGLQVAASLISTGYLTKALLFSGGVGKSVNPEVGSDAGHNGCVCALEYGENCPALFFDFGGDGSTYQADYLPIGFARNPFEPTMFADAATTKQATDQVVDLQKIEDFSLREIPGSITRVLAAAGKSAAEIDGFYLNPMSERVKEVLLNDLRIPQDRVHSVGNDLACTNSGAIPLAMIGNSSSGLRSSRSVSLLSGVGPGLAWGSVLLTTEGIVCPDLMEL